MSEERSGFRVWGSGPRVSAAAGLAALLAWCWLAAGCGRSPEPAGGGERASDAGRKTARAEAGPKRAGPSRPSAAPTPVQGRAKPSRPADQPPAPSKTEAEAEDDWPEPKRVGSLADLFGVPDGASRWVPDLPRLKVDEARAAAAGIRKIAGKRLVLLTDLEPDPEVDVLPQVFDQAFPQWCEYFGVDAAEHADWQMTGFLMKQKSRFDQAGLYPDALPAFRHGFSWNYELWLYEQPSDYYRRHLLLHEGTHGFMNTLLGGCGPPWYMEGIAELLSTHRWQDGRLVLNHMPADRDEVPMWGRIKRIQDDVAAGRARPLESVLQFGPWTDPDTEPYAWCWAAAALLDGHPRYGPRFRQLPRLVLEPDFTRRFLVLMGNDWDPLCQQWQVFITDLEYGHDIAGTAVDFTPGRPLPEDGASVRVAADRGWQNSGLRLEAGAAYRIRASGRYQVADQPQIWWCEPGGVSIRYYKGRPLGILLAAVRAERPRPGEPSALVAPMAVGLDATLRPERSGTLFLRINDSAGELGDNAGMLVVHVKAASES